MFSTLHARQALPWGCDSIAEFNEARYGSQRRYCNECSTRMVEPEMVGQLAVCMPKTLKLILLQQDINNQGKFATSGCGYV